MNKDVKKQIIEAITSHEKIVSEFKAGTIAVINAAVKMIVRSLKQKGCIYICGNGGSASDAQHIAGELVGRFERNRKALAVVALTTDTSIITAIANDYGYENIFVRQVEALVKKGDILLALSTSGTSDNVIAAVKLAKKKGARILGFTGRKNTPLEKLADVCFCANSNITARSQEIHQLAYHIICELVENSFTGH